MKLQDHKIKSKYLAAASRLFQGLICMKVRVRLCRFWSEYKLTHLLAICVYAFFHIFVNMLLHWIFFVYEAKWEREEIILWIMFDDLQKLLFSFVMIYFAISHYLIYGKKMRLLFMDFVKCKSCIVDGNGCYKKWKIKLMDQFKFEFLKT